MKIRLFRAFASNNSGSYTLVGMFVTPAKAEETAALLRDICAAHDGWHETHEWEEDGESPLDVFAREHGLTDEKPGRNDAWPQHGPPPEVLAMGHQVLLHVPYTVTMPRLFGELIYKRGGRVQQELNHSHEQLALEISFHVRDIAWNATERKERYEAVERALTPLLPELCKRKEYDDRPPVEPVFHDGDWGGRSLSAVFLDLVEGARIVRQTAAEHGVEVMIQVQECTTRLADPLAALRGSTRPWGRARVILWSLGADRIAALKAARDVTGAALTEAKALIEDLPKELLIDVDYAFAERAVETLKAAGCDAEAVIPAAPR